MQPVDDSVLLRQFAEDHSDEAFAALVTRHINLVHSVALRCVGDPHQAEEVSQAVFILLARKAAQLRHGKALSSWLFQTTRLTARNYIRSETRRHHREQEAHMQSVLNESGDDVWPRIGPLLDDAVAGLNEKDRHAIMLRFYEARNLREISAALEVSEDAAEKRVNRAVEKLRTFFARRRVSVGASGLMLALSAHAVQAAPAGLAQSIATATLATGLITGASTSTLIAGAWKLVTSTKLKCATIALVIALLAAGTASLILNAGHVRRAGTVPDIQGQWEAVMEIPTAPGLEQGEKAKTRILLTFSKSNGVYTAVAEMIDTNPERLESTECTYEYPVVRFTESRGVSFEGNLTPNGNEIVGNVRAGGKVLHPLRLKRAATSAKVHVPLAQDEHAPRSGSDLQGTWQGILGDGKRVVHVIAKIAEPLSGSYRAELDNETHGWRGQPMSVTYQRPEVSLRVSSGAGMFEGTLNSEHTEMVGSWVQDGQRAPANFRRVD